MKLFPVHPVLLSSLFILWTSQSETETNDPEVCQDEREESFISSEDGHEVGEVQEGEDFNCFLYPTNILNCSWSFQTLQEETQLLVHISVCDNRTAESHNHLSEEKVGSWSLNLDKISHVVFQCNITLHDKWTRYRQIYDIDTLEVLSPPENISVSVKDGDLFVEWSLPYSRTATTPKCFEYQLDLGDQEKPKEVSGQLNYNEQNPDHSSPYRVKIRTKKDVYCIGSSQWSEWSEAVKVEEQSAYELSTVAIISISLGIPMILLALMLVCHQRVSKVLFPPIPHPPQKYKCFLEKNDTFNFFHPALPPEPVEDFIHVEDTEQNPEKTFGK